MFKVFCDRCSKECIQYTRRYENLAYSVDGTNIGFEFLVLFNGCIDGQHHVCDSCFIDMIYDFARKNSLEKNRVIEYDKFLSVQRKFMDANEQLAIKKKVIDEAILKAQEEKNSAERLRLEVSQLKQALEKQGNTLRNDTKVLLDKQKQELDDEWAIKIKVMKETGRL